MRSNTDYTIDESFFSDQKSRVICHNVHYWG